MKSFCMSALVIGLSLATSDLFACPSGQTCPAGKDCVANSSLCVASGSSGSTSGGTSSAPTTVKGQLGLTLESPDSFVRVFNSDSEMISFTFYSPASSLSPVIEGEKVTTERVDALIPLDAQNAPTPSPEGGIWGLPSDVIVH